MSEPQQTQSWRGKVGRMSEAEIAEFLSTDVVCRLSCLDDEGWPYILPTWFQYRDGGYYVIPRERSAWARYLERDPRCYLVMDESGSQRKVLVRGMAELIERPNVGGKWVEIANEMSVRYLGPKGPTGPPDPARTWVVGDDATSDVAMGLAAGLRTVQVRTGKHVLESDDDALPRPEHLIDSIADLPDLLREVAG